ncbi:hypothetical protein, partial [Neisseria sp. P0004.S007]|uniref:hypothetical protein n=1 Tax=Neisseria sp. P0004.S007 TaxID=3436671 RepID=UPI003F80D5DB
MQAPYLAVRHAATADCTYTGADAQGAKNKAGTPMANRTEDQATGIVSKAIGYLSKAIAKSSLALGCDAQA